MRKTKWMKDPDGNEYRYIIDESVPLTSVGRVTSEYKSIFKITTHPPDPNTHIKFLQELIAMDESRLEGLKRGKLGIDNIEADLSHNREELEKTKGLLERKLKNVTIL